MSEIDQPIIDCFLEIQRHATTADAGAIAAAFAPALLIQDAAGSRTMPNDTAFRSAIANRLELLQQAGLHDVKALQIDPQPITAHTALVRVLWSVWFTPKGQADFVLEFAYHHLVTLADGAIQVIAVIEGDDTAEVWTNLGDW